MLGYGKSDVGKVRANNEDVIYVNNEGLGCLSNLFVVADGMGGHNAGEIASKRAVSAFCEFFEKNSAFVYIQDFLADGLAHANERVHLDAENMPELAGMGTTFSACTADENNLYYTHVGDSRIYAVKKGELIQLTRDHSLVAEMIEKGDVTQEEASSHPDKNIITRAVGTDLHVNIDKGYFPLDDVKYILLCSDGLTDMLKDGEIAKIMQADDTAANKVESLIAAALEAGGVDNISVIVMGWGNK